MSSLLDLGLVKSPFTKASSIFEALIPDFSKVRAATPSQYMKICWSKYIDKYPNQRVGTNNRFFHLCVATLLIKEKISPFYMQAQMALVPNVKYDFILYTRRDQPVLLDVAVNLTKYKLTDLEAFVLKNVHRKAKCSLITLDKEECDNLKNKIKNGDVLGLDECIYALGSEFNDFINRLKSESYYCPKPVNVIEKSYTCVK